MANEAGDDLRLVLSEWCEDVIGKIRQNMSDMNVNASGQTSASLEYEVTDDGLTIYAAPYFRERVNTGRTPTVHPQSFDFVSIIKKWVQDKGLTSSFGITDDRDLNKVASAIVYRITHDGSYKYRNPSARTDVYGKVLEDMVPQLYPKVLVIYEKRLSAVLDDKL